MGLREGSRKSLEGGNSEQKLSLFKKRLWSKNRMKVLVYGKSPLGGG